MKKTILTIAMLLACTMGFAQTVNDIFNEIKNNKDVSYINLPKEIISMAMSKVDSTEAKEFMACIDSMKVINTEKFTRRMKKNLNMKLNKLTSNGYSEIIHSSKDKENVSILTKMKNDVITDVLMVSEEGNECSMVQLIGKFKKEDIDKLEQIGLGNNK